MSRADTQQLDLLDLLPKPPRPEDLPAPCLWPSPARGAVARLAVWDEWIAEHGHGNAYRRSRGWHPVMWVNHGKIDGSEGCAIAILCADLRCVHAGVRCWCVGDLVYRFACGGCTAEGPVRLTENDAAEDGLDHTFPGWRDLDLPVLPTSMPDEQKARTRWTEQALELYPAGWLEAGGPVRTARGRFAGRHVPGRTPWGGYDLGVLDEEGSA